VLRGVGQESRQVFTPHAHARPLVTKGHADPLVELNVGRMSRIVPGDLGGRCRLGPLRDRAQPIVLRGRLEVPAHRNPPQAPCPRPVKRRPTRSRQGQARSGTGRGGVPGPLSVSGPRPSAGPPDTRSAFSPSRRSSATIFHLRWRQPPDSPLVAATTIPE